MSWRQAVLAALVAAPGCESRESPEPARSEDARELEPITDPGLVRSLGPAAQLILEQHRDAPLGTEIPIEHQGRRYVARIELHEDADGDSGGKHRGVSVYRTR